MKKLSEVCSIVGVTRRTLQEYEKIGLVKPTDKTDSGYWLYDDTAIRKLFLIQIFVEVGYERKAIKALLESPMLDIFNEFDRLIEILDEKRKRIDGMTNMINSLKLIEKLPESTLRAMGDLDVTRIYEEKSFSAYLEESIIHSAEDSEEDFKEAEMFFPFWYNLTAIGCFLGTPVDNEQVQIAVREAYKCMLEIAQNEDDGFENTSEENEYAEEFSEGIQDMIYDPEIQLMIDLQCGKGAADYIVQATKAFGNSAKDGSIRRQKKEE